MEKLIVIKNTVITGLGIIGGVLSGLLGGFDVTVRVLIIFILADYAAGLVVAGVFKKSGKTANGGLESNAGWKGLMKKCGILLLVLVAAQVDRLITGDMSFVRDGTIIALVANEGLSILENIGLMGVPLPDKLKNALEVLKGKGESKIE